MGILTLDALKQSIEVYNKTWHLMKWKIHISLELIYICINECRDK